MTVNAAENKSDISTTLTITTKDAEETLEIS